METCIICPLSCRRHLRLLLAEFLQRDIGAIQYGRGMEPISALFGAVCRDYLLTRIELTRDV